MKIPAHRMNVAPSVVCAELDGEAVLLDVESGVYYGLNVIGTRIWQLLVQGLDEETIYRQLLREYDVEPVRLQCDVSDFLASLAERGLLHVEPENAS